MEIETREIPLKDRDRYQTRLQSYHAELSKLESDLVCVDFTILIKTVWCFRVTVFWSCAVYSRFMTVLASSDQFCLSVMV